MACLDAQNRSGWITAKNKYMISKTTMAESTYRAMFRSLRPVLPSLRLSFRRDHVFAKHHKSGEQTEESDQ